MNHPPAYEEYSNQSRPKWNWYTPDGNWVGIWGYDWADQLAIECSKITVEFEHEIWQPDLRADKIYSAEINKGVIHRLFPSCLNKDKEIISPLMYSFLSKNDFKDIKHIFHISYPPFYGIYRDIIDSYKSHLFVLSFYGEMFFPLYYLIFKFQRNPLKKVKHFRQHFEAKKYFKLVNYITYMNDKNLKILDIYYKGKKSKITMGISFDKFNKTEKSYCRKLINVSQDKIVLLSVSWLIKRKQIDRIIKILNKINEDFIYIIIGNGSKEYEAYLKTFAEPLLKKGKIRFENYIRGEKLLNYYYAADLFVHPSLSEGASVAVMEAMASGLPIFCTDTGNTAELLKQYGYGCVVGRKNYREWERKLSAYLKGELEIEPLPIQLVKKHYDWQNIANKFLNIYKEISNG